MALVWSGVACNDYHRAGCLDRRSIVHVINSKGIHVGNVIGSAIFDLGGQKLYELKGINIYRLSGELVGHLNDTSGTEKRLDRANDRLFVGA